MPRLRTITLGQQQHPAALFGIVGRPLFQRGKLAAQHILRRTQHIGAPAGKIHRAPLGGRGKGHRLPVGPGGAVGIPLRDGFGRVVVRFHAAVEGSQDVGDLRFRIGLHIQRHHLPHLHLRAGDGAGLIHAQNVHPGQRLDGVHLMDQGPVLRKTNYADRQRHAGQQKQPFRDHADEGRHGGDHRLPQPQFLHGILIIKKRPADGNQHHTDKPDQPVQRAHHFALAGAGVLLGSQCQFGGIGVRPHLIQPCPALAIDDEAAGEQAVPGGLGDGVRLAGDERLIYLHLPGENGGVCRDLTAGSQLDDVLPHQCVRCQFHHHPVPDRPDSRGREQRQLFNGPFGPQLLDNADNRVGGYNEEEGHVPPVPHQQQTHRQHHKNQIEIRQQIFPYDLLIRLGGRGHRPVIPAGLCQCLCLGRGQALVSCRVLQGHLPPVGRCGFLRLSPVGPFHGRGPPFDIF